ncbi:MAG: penicillin-binding protein 1C, partial [Candidatus Hydrogenedentes bacterium]|nr:penicillin-binding protein 1C [Candidatus Hydrogenedentota bacterium]
EDKRFYRHHGVDWRAVVRAAWRNTARRRIVSGASTITMQVVKPCAGDGGFRFASPTLRKLWQAAQAVRLERVCTKDEILDAYLNSAPYGLNLSGVEAAARRYFGKPARELTPAEAALLAGLPKSPTALMPLRNAKSAQARRDYVLGRMRDEGFLTRAEYDEARNQPVRAQWYEFLESAPHFAMRYRAEALVHGRVHSTLDAEIQETAERLAANSMRRYGGRGGISNTAVIVADVPEAHVLAWVGSGGFYSTPGGGQVDAARAPRSPGSALKPFTYALAMEKNLLYASETLFDESLDYGRYQAENFSREYMGMVSASYALSHSLNVPAVNVLNRVGLDPMYTLLHRAGLTTLTRPAEEYGLGLTLGSCEVRLDELTAAYRMLAALGEYRPLRDTEGRPESAPVRLLSRGVCLKIYAMLEQALPGEFDRDLVRADGGATRACWKTGTSSGRRDAWAFVFNAQYVVGVWMGNNNSASSDQLVGTHAALPLAARVFRALPGSSVPDWPDSGDDLRKVRVCAVSGMPATEFCPEAAEEWLPREQCVNRTCGMHGPGARECRPGGAKDWNLARVPPSRRDEREFSAHRTGAPRILDPPNDAEFVLTGEKAGDRIALRSSVDLDTAVHWYLDNRYLGASQPGAPLRVDLTQGAHSLACMTDTGAIDTVSFRVRLPEAHLKFQGG